MVTISCISEYNDPFKPRKSHRSLEGNSKPDIIEFIFEMPHGQKPLLVKYQWDCDMNQWYPIFIDERWIVQSYKPEYQFTLCTDRIVKIANSHNYEQNVESKRNHRRVLSIMVNQSEFVYSEFRDWYSSKQ